jgi:hypothetical protein
MLPGRRQGSEKRYRGCTQHAKGDSWVNFTRPCQRYTFVYYICSLTIAKKPMRTTRKGNTLGAGSFPGCQADSGLKVPQADARRMKNISSEDRKSDKFRWIFASYV